LSASTFNKRNTTNHIERESFILILFYCWFEWN